MCFGGFLALAIEYSKARDGATATYLRKQVEQLPEEELILLRPQTAVWL